MYSETHNPRYLLRAGVGIREYELKLDHPNNKDLH
jgi:hypothetical protein